MNLIIVFVKFIIILVAIVFSIWLVFVLARLNAEIKKISFEKNEVLSDIHKQFDYMRIDMEKIRANLSEKPEKSRNKKIIDNILKFAEIFFAFRFLFKRKK